MAIIDLPSGRAFLPADMSFGSSTSKSGFAGFYSGDMLSTSHLSDRLLCTLTWGPVKHAVDAGRRSALLMHLDSSGDSLRFGPLHRRRAQLGTISGAPTVAADAAAGTRTLLITGAAAGATLLDEDMFSLGGNLVVVGPAGAVADGAGAATVPLALPLQRPVVATTPLVLVNPTGLWLLATDGISMDYSAGRLQRGIALPFRQVFAA